MKRLLLLIALATAALAQSITAVKDGAAYTNDVPQGAVFVVKGTNLSPAGFVQATAPNYPTTAGLNGVRITFTAVSGGTVVNAYMVYTYNQSGVNQLAAVLPSNTALGAYDVRVITSGGTSAAFRTNVVARKPGIVTADGSGSGIAQATIGADFGALVRTSNQGKIGNFNTRPVYPGERIDFWGTGLGADLSSDTGGSSGDQTAAGSIRLLINGTEYTPAYAGRSPGYPGLDEIAVILPQNVTLGCSITVQLRAGGVLGNQVTIATATQGASQCTDSNGGGGGNGGGSITPSQAEVNSWLSSGAFRAGSVTLSKTTNIAPDPANPLVTTWKTTTQSSFSGSFVRMSGLDLNALLNTYTAPNVGQCTVLSVGQTFPFTNLSYTTLDAGSALTSVGPTGTALANKSVALGFISYADAGNLSANYVGAGNYSITGPGGANVGAFSATLPVGNPLVWTNTDAAKTVTRSSGLTVTWTGGDSGTTVSISGASVDLSGSGKVFTCLANRSAGQFTIPANILTQLPASPVFGAGGISIVTRGTLSLSISGNGVRATASGLDYLLISDGTGTSVASQYQ
jgi:uncharacterized protein (TIGR03437 family)